MLTHQNCLPETEADENEGEKTLFSIEKFSWDTKKVHQKEKKNGQLVTNVSNKVLHCFPIQSVRQMTFYPERATVARFNTRMDKNLPWNKFLPHSSVMKSNMVHAWWLSYLTQLGEKIIHDDPKLLHVDVRRRCTSHSLIHNFRLSSFLIFRRFRQPLRNWNKSEITKPVKSD